MNRFLFRCRIRNKNRKRAAYFLKTYYCDDLTPVAVEAESGSGDVHGEKAECRSCHYKLDPMAGFFRNIGTAGAQLNPFQEILFDDDIVQYKEKYFEHWKNKDPKTSSKRPWNIGVVKSADIDQKNYWTNEGSLEELFRHIRKDPDVRYCLVRRLNEFFMGENVSLDPGFLKEMGDDFIKTEKDEGGNKALRQAIHKIVQSKTFAQEYPVKGQCYDRARKRGDSNLVPCQISHYVDQYCAKCHDQAEMPGEIDFTQWVGSSESGAFKYIGDDGKQLSSKKAWSNIRARLEVKSKRKRMPRNTFMPDQARTDFIQWVEKNR